jgi:uncharacterized protein YdeI (YjbR/CyaY-like superfamily)
MDFNLPNEFFPNRDAWRDWLMKNHLSVNEIWIIYFKKHTGKESIIYREALEEALCFGWIDGRVKSIDEERYMQRFTPRRKKGSNWSVTNIRLALELMSEGKMHESGLQFRKYWEEPLVEKLGKVMELQTNIDFEEVLKEFPLALMNFNSLSFSCQKQYKMWVLGAKKEETRIKRIHEAISLLEKGKKLGLK